MVNAEVIKVCVVIAGIVSGLKGLQVWSRMADADGGEMPVYCYRQDGLPALIGGHFPQTYLLGRQRT